MGIAKDKEKEKQIATYMKKLGISKEEATQLYYDDMDDYIGEDGEEMTRKAKKDCKNFVEGDVRERAKTTRERKVDPDKVLLMDAIKRGLFEMDVDILDGNEQSFEINYKGNYYTIKLIFNRNKNKKKA
jgi:hypothetical protein